jgi:hypothetical protein
VTRRFPLALSILLAQASLIAPAIAHPIPDVPVRAAFEAGGACTIQVEVDLRCFDDDPATAPYLLNEFLPAKPEAERNELFGKAAAFVARTVEFYFEPQGRIMPEFQFTFTGKEAAPLLKNDDPVMLTGTWRTTLPTGIRGYRIRSARDHKLSVLFLNQVRGQAVERTQVLFPEESSFLLDLSALSAPPAKPISGRWWKGIREIFR